jgi:hypothetical protein
MDTDAVVLRPRFEATFFSYSMFHSLSDLNRSGKNISDAIKSFFFFAEFNYRSKKSVLMNSKSRIHTRPFVLSVLNRLLHFPSSEYKMFGSFSLRDEITQKQFKLTRLSKATDFQLGPVPVTVQTVMLLVCAVRQWELVSRYQRFG